MMTLVKDVLPNFAIVDEAEQKDVVVGLSDLVGNHFDNCLMAGWNSALQKGTPAADMMDSVVDTALELVGMGPIFVALENYLKNG